jgi:hypothetical protein
MSQMRHQVSQMSRMSRMSRSTEEPVRGALASTLASCTRAVTEQAARVRRGRGGAGAPRVFIVAVALVVGSACRDGHDGEGAPQEASRLDEGPDARLIAHPVVPSIPTPAGLDYVQALAEAHARADATLDAAARRDILSAALDVPAPAGLTEAELFELELAARLAETLRELGDDEGALAVLAPRLAVERSLPRAPEAAHALVVLGDVAHALGDDALAAGSYARALRLLAQLRREVEEASP